MNLTKQSVIISLSNGAEIYLNKENYETFKREIEKNQFVEVGNEFINKSHIVGVLSPETMEAVIRRKNGQWQKNGKWYNKGEMPCPYHPNNIIPFGMKCGECNF